MIVIGIRRDALRAVAFADRDDRMLLPNDWRSSDALEGGATTDLFKEFG